MDTDPKLATSLMIIAPHPVQEIAVPLLKKYAPDRLIRYPAHVPILYPFVDPEYLAGACVRLRDLCANMEPLDITLAGYAYFPKITYMQVANVDPVQAMFQKIRAAFPDCRPYDGIYGPQPYPHMIVAEFTNETKQHAVDLPHYVPFTFWARRLHVMYGPIKSNLPWIAYDIIPLGTA